MSSSEVKRAPISDWEVEQVRATVFFPPNTQLKYDTWWRDVVGSEPDSSVVRSKVGEAVQQGPALGGQFTLRIQPSRADWVLIPASPDPSNPEASVPSPIIGRLAEICPQFSGFVDRWFRMGHPDAIRIAFGAVVWLPVKDRVEGYRQLIPYLPVKIDPESMSDFLYRINRWRRSESGIANLQINRLSTWSVASLEFKRLRVAGDKADVFSEQPVFFCRVELDINTAPDFDGSFSADQSALIFDELKRFGVEIVERGDVP